ncbi:MAG TPA: hypothetical protein VMW74_00795 [Nitrosopumilaceae archaeon]|nr:hypothetical protein [Nitrosopumilaceae archaeon]
MNFLKDKVKKYQEKKLLDANHKLESHTEIKKQLEEQLKIMDDDLSFEIKRKIEKQKELIRIWKKNIEVIKKQLK